jgi:hypothetical protein
MKLTRYQRELCNIVSRKFDSLPPNLLVEELCRMGVIDHTLCKVLAVRTWVDEQTRTGQRKVKAMNLAAEHFCASYEYVRKCMYYYQNVNL